MTGFLTTLFTYHYEQEIYETIDWFLSDEKFEATTWTKNKKSRLTKCLKKKLPLMSEKNEYEYKNVKKFTTEKAKNYKPKIQLTSAGAECEDLIRHIRNGIAHGHACVKKYESQDYIRIIDYTGRKTQSAFMFIPISYLKIICDTYHAA